MTKDNSPSFNITEIGDFTRKCKRINLSQSDYNLNITTSYDGTYIMGIKIQSN